ncbi:MAG: tRNA (adenosine(37)-N6)-dimethylallyltransferase MiaA [Planctomycetota bacterium]|jgi:tRNA dimethylallyltransferase|nr:tRNA (adenosine(37)-N6)-dimethylallyltransferase MiaA [Planctomycetota bacterium]
MKRAFLLGPTASGKTQIALNLAASINAEIISLDSMLVYRSMDLGTAKPSKDELQQVKHHLIDVVDPHEEFSVARYVEQCVEVEEQLRQRKKNALYVGGTTMWFKALVFGLIDLPAVDQQIRDGLQQRLQQEGAVALRQELQKVDPEAAYRIHPNDHRRMLRALETWQSTGRSLSDWQQQWPNDKHVSELAWVLDWPRELLHARVRQRFEEMFNSGLLDEIKAINDGVGFGKTSSKAIGYRQLLSYLDGNSSLEDAFEKCISQTNVLIRRQMTWYRSFSGLKLIDMPAKESNEVLAARLADEFTAN